MSEKAITVAVIGLGRMGQRHLQVAQQLRLNVVGICDQSADAVDSVIEQFNLAADMGFQDVRALLTQAQPDCVIIATTATAHCEYTCLAAEAGVRYILCEKPMAVSLAQCDRMRAACARHNARLAINHQMRFMEQYQEPKRLITTEAFGGLSSVTVVAGNFGLAMNGTHYFEMFRYLTDEAPVEVSAWFSAEKVSNPRGPQFEDRAGSVRVVTASGKRLYLEVSADQGHGINVTYTGRYGQIVVDELAGTLQSAAREEQHRGLPTTRYGMPWVAQSQKVRPVEVIAPTQAVLEALIEGKDFPTGEDGRLAVATLVAAYVSHERGHVPVPVDEHLPIDRVFPWA